MAEQYRAKHLIFAQLFGFRLHHQHGFLGAGHNQVQSRGLQLGIGRVQYVHVVNKADPGSADRTIERNAGNGQRRGGTDHRSDIRVSILADRHHGGDNLHFIHKAFRKQRADRTVDQTAGQGFLLGRTAFTLEEATRNAASCVGLFLIVDGQREEALGRIRFLLANHGNEYGGFADGDHDSAGGLTGDTTRFQYHGVTTKLEFLANDLEHGFLFSRFLR